MSNNDLNDRFVTTIREEADSIFPKKEQIRNRQPWHNDVKLQELFIRKDELMLKNADRKVANSNFFKMNTLRNKLNN